MIGRALGIGVRVAGRIAGQQFVAGSSFAARPRSPQSATPASSAIGQRHADAQTAGRIVAQAGRGVSRGLGGFLKPFRHVGGIVWLEVTGFFFLLFAVLFAFRLWQNWSGLSRQPVQRGFIIAVAVVFVYLGLSSFWRARRRSQSG